MVTENGPGKATEPGFSHPVRLVPELAARQAARRPGATAVIMVLDENLAPVPAGTAGGIWTGGCGVARGYLGDAGLTAARFVPGRDEGRMCRTGDAGRWRADGQLEVSGRIDRQLQVNGFRVDPGNRERAGRSPRHRPGDGGTRWSRSWPRTTRYAARQRIAEGALPAVSRVLRGAERTAR